MKILIITKWLVKWNGASRVVYELSKRFKKHNEVKIAVYSDYVDPDWEKEFDIYKIRHKGLFSLREIRGIIKDYDPDIIHSHDWLGLLALFTKKPHIATTHSNWPMNWFFSLESFLAGLIQEIPHEIKLHMVNKVVSVSKYQKNKLKGRMIDSTVIYNGIGDEFFNSPKDRPILKKPAILFVGTVDKRKAKYLEPIIKLLNKRKAKINVYILGLVKDNKMLKNLQSLNNVYYMGVIDDPKPYYYEADILIFPSREEACPLVPIEAQACGLPVVAFDVCSNSEIVNDGETGFLVESGDLGGMVEKVGKLIDDNELREKMKKKCVNHIKENFLWDDKVNEYNHLLKVVLESTH